MGFILACSALLGGGISHFANGQTLPKSVDQATGNYRTGEELYLQSCSGCHIPIPPAVLPTKTWQTILENPRNHYGTQLEGIVRFNQVLMWQYLKNYSRPLLPNENEPKFMAQSRYFFALHPQVDLPSPVSHRSCLQCHTGAQNFDYSLK